MLTASEIIKRLHLTRNEAEGGLFAGTYTSSIVLGDPVLPAGFPKTQNGRPICSAIYYFLQEGDFSALHKVSGDMIYHFYRGHSVEMMLLHPDGSSQTATFSPEILNDGSPMKIIPGGTWLGTRLKSGGSYALMGVSMAPGFDPSDYTIGDRDELTAKYPTQEKLIKKLTRPK